MLLRKSSDGVQMWFYWVVFELWYLCGWQCCSVGWSVWWASTSVQSEVSQQLLHGLSLKFVETFMVPRAQEFKTFNFYLIRSDLAILYFVIKKIST